MRADRQERAPFGRGRHRGRARAAASGAGHRRGRGVHRLALHRRRGRADRARGRAWCGRRAHRQHADRRRARRRSRGYARSSSGAGGRDPGNAAEAVPGGRVCNALRADRWNAQRNRPTARRRSTPFCASTKWPYEPARTRNPGVADPPGCGQEAADVDRSRAGRADPAPQSRALRSCDAVRCRTRRQVHAQRRRSATPRRNRGALPISRHGTRRKCVRDDRIARGDVRHLNDVARSRASRTAGRRAGLSVVREDGVAQRRRLPRGGNARGRRFCVRCAADCRGGYRRDARDRHLLAVQSDGKSHVERSGRPTRPGPRISRRVREFG